MRQIEERYQGHQQQPADHRPQAIRGGQGGDYVHLTEGYRSPERRRRAPDRACLLPPNNSWCTLTGMAKPGALANLDHDAAIEQLCQGRLLKHIAADYGVSKVAVYKRLRNHPDYQDAIAQQAEALVEQAVDEVFNCDAETVNIARARADTAFKWAAARDPARWGAKQQIEHTIIDRAALLADARSRVIDVTPDVAAQLLVQPDSTD